MAAQRAGAPAFSVQALVAPVRNTYCITTDGALTAVRKGGDFVWDTWASRDGGKDVQAALESASLALNSLRGNRDPLMLNALAEALPHLHAAAADASARDAMARVAHARRIFQAAQLEDGDITALHGCYAMLLVAVERGYAKNDAQLAILEAKGKHEASLKRAGFSRPYHWLTSDLRSSAPQVAAAICEATEVYDRVVVHEIDTAPATLRAKLLANQGAPVERLLALLQPTQAVLAIQKPVVKDAFRALTSYLRHSLGGRLSHAFDLGMMHNAALVDPALLDEARAMLSLQTLGMFLVARGELEHSYKSYLTELLLNCLEALLPLAALIGMTQWTAVPAAAPLCARVEALHRDIQRSAAQQTQVDVEQLSKEFAAQRVKLERQNAMLAAIAQHLNVQLPELGA